MLVSINPLDADCTSPKWFETARDFYAKMILYGQIPYDEYFEKAGRFIIEKNKASIGMLQRVLKIGFNRAARIMDQLAEAGVVSEDNGTRARQVLMDMTQFEQFLEEM